MTWCRWDSSLAMADAMTALGGVDRMFTSRSEYRMTIRADNADSRLTAKGRAAGVVTDARWEKHSAIESELERARGILNGLVLSPQVR